MRWAWEHCFCYFTAIALDRLGPSLGALIKEVEESKFSLKTTLQIMNQVITRIQALHERHIIHRGIKPDNFCIGMPGSKTENTVYMIDFDHAKKFRDPLTHLHIPYREENDVGNSSQTSLGVHPWTSLAVDQRVEASRRDDMESAGYMAVLFLKGCLPWCYGRDYCPSYPEHLESKRINVSMEKYDQNADILLREGHQSRISLRRPPRRAQDLHLLLPFSQIRRRARL
ncbi:hypothetical protein, variant 2 [Cryptococcus amylolentus CBS 6039]|nr:hypothetical protein, variant 2 [Cryptococcus amylolentus CBS 6039]ODN74122.1 hypothetical protein, variant 2 [Cryptococcus amylolentus CBS 6039]